MKTTKKDWIYRVILLILLAIIWDIGAALTSPILFPERRCVSRILPVDPKWNNVESIPIFAGSHYGGSRFECRHLHSSWLSDENLSFASKTALSSNSSNAVLPVTAFYPLLTMWFGIGEKMKIAFLFVASFVFMLPSVLIAMDDVSDDVIEAASIDGAGKFSTVTRIIFPIAAPSICQSFATMYAIGWTYIAVAETVNAKYGIGYLIYTSSARGRTSLVFVGILAIVIFSILFDWVTNICIKKAFKWKFS